MKTCVCITTINAPTESVRAWVKLYPDGVIVVGDAKTPSDWLCQGSFYFPTSAGLPSLSNRIGDNRYQRKMLGYVSAAIEGADVIIDTDDDNEPWSERHRVMLTAWQGAWHEANTPGWMNPHAYYNERYTWPRGLPLPAIAKDGLPLSQGDVCQVGIWQGLAQENPDLDAIGRLTDGRPVVFPFYHVPFTLAPGTLAPINSQATLIRRECFPLLYLPCTVSMRVCDILRGYVAQPVMWAAGYRIGFCGPIVRQQRNPHDLMDDFRQELPLYLGMGEAVIEKVCAVVKPEASMADNLRAAYRAIVGVHGIGDESATLEEWLAAILPLR